MIKFNQVTWYSKLAAAILFILVLPILTFYIGIQYQATMTIVLESKNIPMIQGENTPTIDRAQNKIASDDADFSKIINSAFVKTYHSSKCGFEFKYPTYANFIEDPDESSCEYLKILLKGKTPSGNDFVLNLYGQPIIISKGGSPDIVYDTLDEIEQHYLFVTP